MSRFIKSIILKCINVIVLELYWH